MMNYYDRNLGSMLTTLFVDIERMVLLTVGKRGVSI